MLCWFFDALIYLRLCDKGISRIYLSSSWLETWNISHSPEVADIVIGRCFIRGYFVELIRNSRCSFMSRFWIYDFNYWILARNNMVIGNKTKKKDVPTKPSLETVFHLIFVSDIFAWLESSEDAGHHVITIVLAKMLPKKTPMNPLFWGGAYDEDNRAGQGGGGEEGILECNFNLSFGMWHIWITCCTIMPYIPVDALP